MEKLYISSGKQCRMKIGLSTQDYAQILFIFILQVYIRCLQSVQCFSFPNRTNVTSLLKARYFITRGVTRKLYCAHCHFDRMCKLDRGIYSNI